MMGAVMAIIMLLFMRKMYHNKKVNGMIFLTSVAIFLFVTLYGQKSDSGRRCAVDEGDDSSSLDCCINK